MSEAGGTATPGLDEQKAVLLAAERSTRAALAMAPSFIEACGALPELSPAFASLREDMKGMGVPLVPWLKAVKQARGARAPTPHLHLVSGSPGLDPRPVIHVECELQETVDAAIEALAADEDVYQRSISLVHIVHSAGAPMVYPLELPTLRERLGSSARFDRFEVQAGERRRCLAPDTVVQAVAARKTWRGIRQLEGVIEYPTMRPDGSLLSEPGYDEATRLFYKPSAVIPAIPDRPIQDEGKRALGELQEVFCDFPHRSPADLSGSIASLLTILARSAVAGNVPAFLFDSSTPAAGKSLQAKVVHIIATGRVPEALGYPEDDDEAEKFLSAIASSGQPVLLLDDLDEDGPGFGGPGLNRVLTCGGATGFRELGKNRKLSLPWRTVILASGNNIALRGAMDRRILVPRLEPDCERPELRRKFLHPELEAWALEHRGRLVAAALTILRCYVSYGSPDCGTPIMGSFEQWSKLVPPAIVFAGGADPMGCLPASSGATGGEERITVRVLFEGLARFEAATSSGMGVTARQLLDALYPAQREHGPPDAYGDLREAIENLTKTPPGKKPSGAKLGRGVLSKVRGRWISGMRLEICGENRTGTALWRVAKAEKAAAKGTPADTGPEQEAF